MLRDASRIAGTAVAIATGLTLAACQKPFTPTQPAASGLAIIPVESEPRSQLPDGLPVRISGIVHEQDPIADVPIPGVTIEIIDGEFKGRSTVTDSDGVFSLPGETLNSATLKLTKLGYEERQYRIEALRTPEGRIVNIALQALPPTARLDIRIDDAGSTNAIFQHSQIRFDASSSRAVRPAYSIEFGDGESTTEKTAVHPCNRSGILTSRVTVTDAFGRTATVTASYRCIGLYQQIPGRETWDNSEIEKCRPHSPGRKCPNDTQILFSSQLGARVSGLYFETDYDRNRRVPFTGQLSGDRTIRIVLDDRSVELVGEVLLDDRRTGSSEERIRHLKLLLKGGRDDGRRLDFEYHEHDW